MKELFSNMHAHFEDSNNGSENAIEKWIPIAKLWTINFQLALQAIFTLLISFSYNGQVGTDLTIWHSGTFKSSSAKNSLQQSGTFKSEASASNSLDLFSDHTSFTSIRRGF